MGAHSVTCHFCSMQDSFEIVFELTSQKAHFSKEHVPKIGYHYSRNGLCPRGNFCLEALKHTKRVAYCTVDGMQTRCSEALETVKERLKSIDPAKVAILISGSVPLEVAYKTALVANSCGIRFVSTVNFDDIITAKFMNNYSREKIAEQEIILAIGDVFTNHPTISKLVHDARFAERKNFLAVVDNASSRTSWFAWQFLKTKPGRTAAVVKALAKAVRGEKAEVENIDVDKATFDKLVNLLQGAKSCAVLYSPGTGRFMDPLSIGYWAKQLADARGFMFAAMSTSSNGRGVARILEANGLGNLKNTLAAINAGDIEALICLGCDPVEAYPGIYQKVKDIPVRIATATLPTAITKIAQVVLPTKFLFERTGTILSLSERKYELSDSVPSPDYPCECAVLDSIAGVYSGSADFEQSEMIASMDSFAYLAEEPEIKEVDLGEIPVVGYSLPHHHGDGSITRKFSWIRKNTAESDGNVLISPAFAKKMGIMNGDSVVVETKDGKGEFTVRIQEDLTDDIVLVPVYMPSGRAVLGWDDDFGFVPTTGRIEKV